MVYLIVPALYLVVAVVVTLLWRLLDNPYQHETSRVAWLQAIVGGLFWLPALMYAVVVYVYYEYFTPRN